MEHDDSFEECFYLIENILHLFERKLIIPAAEDMDGYIKSPKEPEKDCRNSNGFESFCHYEVYWI